MVKVFEAPKENKWQGICTACYFQAIGGRKTPDSGDLAQEKAR
jgi:hypothetical protein